MTRRILHWGIGVLLSLGVLLTASLHTAAVPAVTAAGTWSGNSTGGMHPWDHFTTIRVTSSLSLNVNNDNNCLLLKTAGLDIPGVNGLDEVVAPAYSSCATYSTTDLGYGWTMGTGRDVGLQISSGSVTFIDGGGAAWTFTQSGSTFLAPAGIDATLVQNPDGSYTLTFHASGMVYSFTSGGFLALIQNRQGNRISFGYNSSNQLTQITNTEGQVTTITYSTSSVVITGPGAQTWTYALNASNELAQITDPAGNVTQFAYFSKAGTPHLLDQVTDPDQHVTGIGYFANYIGEVPHWTGQVASIGNWNFLDSSGNPHQTVTDPNGNTTSFGFDSSNRLVSITNPDTTATALTWTSDNHLASL